MKSEECIVQVFLNYNVGTRVFSSFLSLSLSLSLSFLSSLPILSLLPEENTHEYYIRLYNTQTELHHLPSPLTNMHA